MKIFKIFIAVSLIQSLNSCISKYSPEINESMEMLVVEGIITDQPGSNIIKLSKSIPMGRKINAQPLSGCNVTIKDDEGNWYRLTETVKGTYKTDSTEFRGIIGRKYSLQIVSNNSSTNFYYYESVPMEMKPVPPIDKIYWEKVLIEEAHEDIIRKEGCQIYLDTYDPEKICTFFRWNYTETWEFHLPMSFDVINKVCWITNKSNEIFLKNTSSLSESTINRFPVKFITNETDRLSIKYSILINQFSLNNDEYIYWEKMRNITETTGSLYDITPASIPGNMFCVDDPTEIVLGYFSVSAKSSKRIFIEDHFDGVVNLYMRCENGRAYYNNPIIDLGIRAWIIVDGSAMRPPFRIYTWDKNCADCTTRGTTVKPSFWYDNE